MKKILSIAALVLVVSVAGNSLMAQTKNGLISMSELLKSMPEFKKADTSLSLYRATLEQQFDAYQKEFEEQRKMLTSPDTLKYTQVQLSVKRQTLLDIGYKLQNYNEEASRLLEQRRQEIFLPIQRRADDAIQAVAKENGYVYVFEKETLHTYPPADDILPLVKKKLGIRNRLRNPTLFIKATIYILDLALLIFGREDCYLNAIIFFKYYLYLAIMHR